MSKVTELGRDGQIRPTAKIVPQIFSAWGEKATGEPPSLPHPYPTPSDPPGLLKCPSGSEPPNLRGSWTLFYPRPQATTFLPLFYHFK